MKYCLSGRQKKDYLKKADEILVEFRDYSIITDYFVDYPETMIILDIPNNESFEQIQKSLLLYKEASNNFCCRIYNLNLASWFKENNIKFYYGFAIENYYDLQGLIKLGVEYVKIGCPIVFNMPLLKEKYSKVKFRAVPNIAYSAYIPRENGLCGQWIRPEDVKYYEDSIYVFEFEDIDRLDKERTLYRIYAEQKEWNDNLNFLITNLDVNIASPFLPKDFGQVRSQCRQKCMENANQCWFCETALKFQKNFLIYDFNKRFSDDQQKENN